jgi:hypothetical protein
MYELNTDRLYKDTIKRLHEIKKSQDYLAAKLNCSRVVFWQLSKRGAISFSNFFKLCDWLNEEPQKYFRRTIKPKENAKNIGQHPNKQP